MRCLIQYNILLKSKYGSLRVHKSTWQVGAVYSFFATVKNADLLGYIHTKVGKRTAFGFFISQINEKNGESENEGYKVHYCR